MTSLDIPPDEPFDGDLEEAIELEQCSEPPAGMEPAKCPEHDEPFVGVQGTLDGSPARQVFECGCEVIL